MRGFSVIMKKPEANGNIPQFFLNFPKERHSKNQKQSRNSVPHKSPPSLGGRPGMGPQKPEAIPQLSTSQITSFPLGGGRDGAAETRSNSATLKV